MLTMRPLIEIVETGVVTRVHLSLNPSVTQLVRFTVSLRVAMTWVKVLESTVIGDVDRFLSKEAPHAGASAVRRRE